MLNCYICDDNKEDATRLMHFLKKFITNDGHSISVTTLTSAGNDLNGIL